MKGKLLITERIFGSARDGDGTWRIKTHDELNNLVRNKNIINYCTAKKLSWLGHIRQMTNDRLVK